MRTVVSAKQSGQFIIVAAVLILVVMLGVIIFLYSNLPTQSVSLKDIQNATTSVITSINTVYSAGASMYSTILNVTGNYTYARLQASSVMASGFDKLSILYSSYGLSISTPLIYFKTSWYSPYSYTLSEGSVKFNLSSYGVYGASVGAVQELAVQVVCSPTCINKGEVTLNITTQGTKPDSSLNKQMFYFLVYDNTINSWVKAQPTSFVNYQNGTYVLGLPPTATPQGFLVGVRDSRGILVIASSFTKLTYTFNWAATDNQATSMGVNTGLLQYVPLTLQILTNGTIQLIGQNLITTTNLQPIPPIPVKDIRVNETVGSGRPSQVPFQVEDWGFDYTRPLALTSPYTLFSDFQMIVTLVNTSVNSVTVYWNGTDSAPQSSFSIPGSSFANSNSCGQYCIVQINNGVISVQFIDQGGFCSSKQPDTLQINTYSSSSSKLIASVSFENLNGYAWQTDCDFGVVVLPGVVREIAFGGFVYDEFGQHENTGAYNMFPTLTFLIPKSAPYITAFAVTQFGVDYNPQFSRQISSYNLVTLISTSQIGGSIFVQNSNSPTNNNYGSKSNYFYNDTSPNTVHLWSAICTSQTNRNNNGGDPCNPGQPNLGVIMALTQENSLYGLAKTFGSCSQACLAGVLASSSSSSSLSITPYFNKQVPLSFQQSYTMTWIGLIWFWPGTQRLHNIPYNLDIYTISPLFEAPPTVAITLS